MCVLTKKKTNSHVLSFFKKISTIEKLKVNFKNKMPNSSLDGWFFEEQKKLGDGGQICQCLQNGCKFVFIVKMIYFCKISQKFCEVQE